MADSGSCLVLMLKAPERSKRRLAEEIGSSAVEAAERLTACALEDMLDWQGPRCFAPAAEADARWLADHLSPPIPQVVQQGENLGARINHVNDALIAQGAARQLFIGIDCPALDQPYLRQADAALERHDAVLGPALDGGVVLMGARRRWPDLTDLPWSTDRLHDRLRALCTVSNWSVATLEPRADIDNLTDLMAMRQCLRLDPRQARRALRRWLLRLDAEAPHLRP